MSYKSPSSPRADVAIHVLGRVLRRRGSHLRRSSSFLKMQPFFFSTPTLTSTHAAMPLF